MQSTNPFIKHQSFKDSTDEWKNTRLKHKDEANRKTKGERRGKKNERQQHREGEANAKSKRIH
jgi:hypothetical protein